MGSSLFFFWRNDSEGAEHFHARHVDANAKASVDALHDAGVRYINTYMFPCPTCGISASTQVRQLKDAGLRVSQVWLDIEGPQYWHSSQTENRAFLTELYHAATSEFGNVGIYSSESQWSPIFGRLGTRLSRSPLVCRLQWRAV